MWHVCQSGLQNLGQHWSLTWQLVILALVAAVLIRGGWSMVQQVWRTRRFVGLFWPLSETPPARLLSLLEAHHLSAEKIVYLNLATTQAFCLGFWRPRIWLTAGLIELPATLPLIRLNNCLQRSTFPAPYRSRKYSIGKLPTPRGIFGNMDLQNSH